MIAPDILDGVSYGTTNTNEIWSRNLQLHEKKYTYLHTTLELFVNDLQVSVATTVGKIIVASKCNYAITKKKIKFVPQIDSFVFKLIKWSIIYLDIQRGRDKPIKK